jgi:hypothetical protein
MQALPGMRQWQDAELKLFYDEYHRVDADAEQVCASLTGVGRQLVPCSCTRTCAYVSCVSQMRSYWSWYLSFISSRLVYVL